MRPYKLTGGLANVHGGGNGPRVADSAGLDDLVCGTQGMDAGSERVHDGGAT
jgi:hypothetical protein